MTPAIQSQYSITEYELAGQHGPMRYWASTPHQGVPIVLIHGYGGLIEHWRQIMPSIVRNHTLYALDLYGFGFSARPCIPPSRVLWATQVADLIRQIVAGPAVVVGHSLGGMVAAQTAAMYPDLVRGLVLVNSAGLSPASQPSTFDRLFFNLLKTEGIGEMLAGVFANPWSIRQVLRTAYYREECVTPELVKTFYAPLRQPGGPQYYVATSRAFYDMFLNIQPGDVQTPTLLIWGAEDRSLPVSVANAFQQRMFPQAEIHAIPASGHCPFDETPESFCDILLPWVARL